MITLEVFEKVSLIIPIEQRRFFNYFNDTVEELLSMYDGYVLKKNTEFSPLKDLSDECAVLPLYTGAIVDNILFLANGEEVRKNEFLRKAHRAYLKYWDDNIKGRRVKRMRW